MSKPKPKNKRKRKIKLNCKKNGKSKVGCVKSSSAASASDGITMFMVQSNDKDRTILGYYGSKDGASRACGGKSMDVVRAFDRKKDKGVIGSEKQFIVTEVKNCNKVEGATEEGNKVGIHKMQNHRVKRKAAIEADKNRKKQAVQVGKSMGDEKVEVSCLIFVNLS